MSSNLLKYGYHYLREKDTRVIDSNEAVEIRINENRKKQEESRKAEPDGEQFTDGLQAPEIEVLVDPDSGEDSVKTVSAAREEAEQLIADARQEIGEMKAAAREEAEQEKEEIRKKAKEAGYREGKAEAEKELEEKKRALSAREKELEAEYEKNIQQLEPEFVSVLTEIYEHIFEVDLSSYRQMIVNLISNALHHIEGAKNFIVHVSSEDYPLVNLQKNQITASAPPSVSVEFTEDITLKQNECMIETENGIYDCGLGTQLTELKQKLTLLSFEREEHGDTGH